VSTPEGTFARQYALRAVEALQRHARGPQRALIALQSVRHAVWCAQQAEIFWIEAARDEGASWEDIAQARGTTRQNEAKAHARRIAAREYEARFDRWLTRRRIAVRNQIRAERARSRSESEQRQMPGAS
jgi:hypothetical protein